MSDATSTFQQCRQIFKVQRGGLDPLLRRFRIVEQVFIPQARVLPASGAPDAICLPPQAFLSRILSGGFGSADGALGISGYFQLVRMVFCNNVYFQFQWRSFSCRTVNVA